MIILLWLIEGNWKYKLSQYKTNPLIITLSLFIILSIVSIFWASNIFYGLDYVSKYKHLIIIAVIYTSLDKKFIKHILSAFLISMFISEVVSYGIFFEIWNYKNISPHDPSPFMNHTDYSIYLTFTAMILLSRIFYENNLKYRLVYILFFISVTANLFVNGGRTGQVTFFIVLFMLFLLNMKNKIMAIIFTILISMVTFIAAYNLSPNFHNRFNQATADITNMIEQNNFKGSFATRVSLWIVGVEQISDNLLFGSGIGNEMKNVNYYSKDNNWTTNNLARYGDHHNIFITYGVQLGILGLILILLIFYSLIILKYENKQYKNLNYIFIITYILWSFGGLTFHLHDSIVFFALFAGLFNKISLLEKRREII
ncbi:MAG: O-antigen ligase family protein [Campylobacterota bacterium]|nr:O-antigen ligase family protein [Campylobacterota bacterium]